MPSTRYSSYLAFSFLLVLLIAGSLLVQTFGHLVNINLARSSLFIALPVALVFTELCFPADNRHIAMAALQVLLVVLLTALGLASRHWYDFTADGLGYQQPTAEAILNGWNPFGAEPQMLWQQIYPSGAGAVEASLAALYGSIECAKMLQIWWLFIALPVFLCGISAHLGSLRGPQAALAALSVLSVTVLAQLLTHYVDALIYLSGMAFLGGLLLFGHGARGKLVSLLIMGSCVLFIVNAKLSGIYHAAALCAAAVLFLWLKEKRFPWMPAIVLFAAGLVAVFFIGFRPYVTNYESYGIAMFPDKPDAFSGTQRPSSFDDLPSFGRYFYSLFSVTGGGRHEPALAKLPWTLRDFEWKASGTPDARTGGFGPLFAFGFIASIGLFGYALARGYRIDKGLVLLAAICLLSSALFPQSWWARYVPFGYTVPFLLLLSLPWRDNLIRSGLYTLAFLFAINSAMAASAAYVLFRDNQAYFMEVAADMRAKPAGSVYLVPPAANYRKYNDAYMPLQRRLSEQGVATTLKVDDACPHLENTYAEYKLCY